MNLRDAPLAEKQENKTEIVTTIEAEASEADGKLNSSFKIEL